MYRLDLITTGANKIALIKQLKEKVPTFSNCSLKEMTEMLNHLPITIGKYGTEQEAKEQVAIINKILHGEQPQFSISVE